MKCGVCSAELAPSGESGRDSAMKNEKLSLREELLLVSLDDHKGTISFSTCTGLPYGLAGAALLELFFAKLVRVEGADLVPKGTGSTHDERLDEMLKILRASSRPRSAKHWISRFGRSSRKLKQDSLASLIRSGVLSEKEGRFLWVFPIRRYPESNATPEREIRSRVRAAILGTTRADERTFALISLLHACDLVSPIFEKGERSNAKRRAKEIAKQEPLGAAVGQVIAGVRGAIIAASAAGAAAA